MSLKIKDPDNEAVGLDDVQVIDKQSAAKSENDADEQTKEARQAHGFRDNAFSTITRAIKIVVRFWCILMLTGLGILLLNAIPAIANFIGFTPLERDLYYLLLALTSITTVLTIALAIGILSFAIRCYGHHNNKGNIECPVPWKVAVDLVSKGSTPTQ